MEATPALPYDDDNPVAQRFAVLIPAYNEQLVLKGTVDALFAASMPVEHIYLVDDRSTDDTAAIGRALGLNVYTVPVNGGKANAQRQALIHFDLLRRYDWIMFLDGDSKVGLDFVREMLAAVTHDPTVALYVGQVKSVKNTHIFSASRSVEYAFGHDMVKAGQANFGVIFVSPGCASMYSTRALARLHIQPDTLAEDMDLTMQAQRAGERVAYVPNAVVLTQDPRTFKDYHKQILRWQRGFWQVVRKHGVFRLTLKKQRVDWLMMFLALDSMFFNRFVSIAFMLLLGMKFSTSMAVDILVGYSIVVYAAFKTHRTDVLWKFPGFYWIGYLHYYAFMRTFFEIIVFRKHMLSWNKVERYDFDTMLVNHTSKEP